jgi:hypothetical protein
MERKGIPQMSDSTLETATRQAATLAAKPKRLALTSQYKEDHRHPVNHFLHVGVGWPMAALAVILLPFRPVWSVGLFVSAYAIMFFGHFVFERNIPTIFKEPSTPFVMAFTVIRQMLQAVRKVPVRWQCTRGQDTGTASATRTERRSRDR